jgi:hypothetical protein
MAKTNLTQQQEEEIVKLYQEGTNKKVLIKEFHIRASSLNIILNKYNIEQRKPNWFIEKFNNNKSNKIKQLENEIINYAKKMKPLNLTKLSIYFKISRDKITEILKDKLNYKINNCQSKRIRRFKKLINYRYFSCINSVEKAYWLGYLYGDGGIELGNRISLTSIDYNHLINYKNSLSSNLVIKKRTTKSSKLVKEEHISYRINFRDKYMCSDLSNKGIIPNKTYDQKNLPYIPKHYIKDYIRGIIDSDGSMCLTYKKERNRTYIIISITNTNIELLEYIKNYFGKGSIISKDNNLAKQLNIYFVNNIEPLKEIYYSSCLCLRRKKVNLLKYGRLLEKSGKLLPNKIGEGPLKHLANTEEMLKTKEFSTP